MILCESFNSIFICFAAHLSRRSLQGGPNVAEGHQEGRHRGLAATPRTAGTPTTGQGSGGVRERRPRAQGRTPPSRNGADPQTQDAVSVNDL